MTRAGQVRDVLLSHWWAPALVLGAMTLTACAHHHHHDYEDRVIITDDHGFAHEGYYDADHHWRGGYYDEHHEYHDDPGDWHH